MSCVNVTEFIFCFRLLQKQSWAVKQIPFYLCIRTYEGSSDITFLCGHSQLMCVSLFYNIGPGSPLHKTRWSWSTIGYPAKYKSATESATCSTPPTTELLSKGPASVETTSCHGCKWVYSTLLLLLLCVCFFLLFGL